ncbi:MAG: dockerin type I repeat-containing protein, partial [Oscillospiraceae bacterium]|nr:dockerin type I repeat-containing protein [Oscillospiraceae bacterium]
TTTTGITTTTTTSTAPVTDKLMLGDVDCNGEVDVSDTVLLARMLSEDSDAIVTAQGMKNADCDQDGKPSMDDATLILQHIAKLRLLPVIEK